MRIAFVTNCLEPERDGVGDYTLLLAEECGRRGHQVHLLALNDRFVTEQQGDGWTRLGESLSWRTRMEKAARALATFSPERTSLQFVCYGFHPRGLNLMLGARLKKIIGSCPVQMMCHELWIGVERNASFKHRVVGAVQRRGLMGVVRQLAPSVVHTSNAAYAGVLRRCGIEPGILPLFGTVPLLSDIKAPRSKNGMTFGMFGSLHAEWKPEPLFSHLRELFPKITIAHVGAIGSGADVWRQMTADYAGQLEFQRLGEQPREVIADFLLNVDFGIATTPWELIGKSGTVATMLEHGLPVIVTRDDVHFTDWSDETYSDQLIRMDGDLPGKISSAVKRPPHSKLAEIASQFLHDLERSR